MPPSCGSLQFNKCLKWLWEEFHASIALWEEIGLLGWEVPVRVISLHDPAETDSVLATTNFSVMYALVCLRWK
jgi:hypothetical protein